MHTRCRTPERRRRPDRPAACAMLLALFASSAAFADDAAMSAADRHRPSDPPGQHGLIVIAHRGASGYRPEHTLEAYRLAIRQGADFIEPDLVATKDGVLVARHENEISGTTDVASHPEFASRRTTKTIDGVAMTGWFTEDFTLAELKTLRAKERIPAIRPDNTRFDGMYSVPTLVEVIELAKRESRNGRRIGIYPETKHPTYFAREGRRIDGKPIGVSLGAKLVETLVQQRFTDPRRVYIQSFEFENLVELKKKLMPAAGIDLPLVQLYDDFQGATPYDITYNLAHGADLSAVYGGLVQQAGGIDAATRYGAFTSEPVLAWMKANYASGVGPWKGNLLPRQTLQAPVDANGDGKAELAGQGTGLVHPMLAWALKAGLQVHPYTLRAEEVYLAQTPGGVPQSVVAEAVQLYGLGVQGFFIDQPDQGVLAREVFLEINRQRER
ncbi:glycerophosphodiester phosphodiesterase family protein [Lysobacter panacisoli]|uniref:glycerophosphodiester phosphodiesterase n=1 Tax=Lysobacter panacisoli TaxID=1255263 RepID=A0ABP9L7T4_9GAMM|nr:glycerophosphodiester phosphodiesterase family protein [Lysobacter panacisoli]